MKPNSFCCECGKACRAPRGNWNAQRVSLCSSKVCRRKRKSALQKERRKQTVLPLGLAADAPIGAPLKRARQSSVKSRVGRLGTRKDSRRKTKFFGGLVD
jgi:hypothetical protein